MSRIGKKPVPIPKGVKVSVGKNEFVVEGKHGKLSFPLFPDITIKVDGEKALVSNNASGKNKKAKAFYGLVRAYLANMVRGVTEPWQKRLKIEGVGYNAKVQGKKLVLQIGFCHPVNFDIPKDLNVECPSPTEIIVTGIDKQKVGQFAANVRRVRPPEPYKGKGIRYADEEVKRKPGKSVTSAG